MKKTMKKTYTCLLSLVLGAALLFSLAGCSGSTSGSSGTGDSASPGSSPAVSAPAQQGALTAEGFPLGGKVTLGMTGNPTEFFTPYKQGTLNSYGWTVFEPLAWDRTDGTFEPCLAESWEVDQDQNTLTVKLREGIHFSNGDPLTADDVVFTLTCRQEYGTYGLIGSPVSVEKLDEYTVKVTWETFSLNFAGWVLPQYIYSQKVFEEKGLDWMLTNMVGTGPYVMNEYIPDVRLSVTRNENYWREEVPGPDEFEWVCVTDQTAMLAAFLNKEIDNLNQIQDPAYLAQLESEGYEPVEMPVSREMQYFAVPISTDPNDPLSDPDVRRAIYLYGIDWDNLALTVSGESSYHTDSIGKLSMPYYAGSLEASEYDPEKAKKMLEEAGYGEGFTTTIYAIPDMAGQATYMQDALRNLGITAEIVTVDYTLINGEYLTGNAVSNGIVMSVMAYNDYTTNQDDRFNKFFSPIGALKGITDFSEEQMVLWENVRNARSLEEQSKALSDFVNSYVAQSALVWPVNNISGSSYEQPWYHVEQEAYCASAGRDPRYVWVEAH
ncbi:ABC transporter substrate-binding protein [Ruthenibacterium lactatiformans]|uniref:ABC transporter substrate-binding protein n=1 Tax=Ruthenibacterium lactatiformans TaxID=1550024 RepID=UPI0030807631